MRIFDCAGKFLHPSQSCINLKTCFVSSGICTKRRRAPAADLVMIELGFAGGDCLETAIGVFSSRHGAEEAVEQLRQKGIPEEAIVFLTWSENEAKVAARRFAAIAGLAEGAADASVAIAEFLLPGMGTVFALGFGKVTLLRLAAVRAASAVGLHVMDMHVMDTHLL